MTDPDDLEVIGRAENPRGEVVLRRRGRLEDAVLELIVNGAFAMDSTETVSERALAELPFDDEGARVLLGGLGLGYTAEALLQRPIAALTVVELEPALIAWARAGKVPVAARVARDPRVQLVEGDVAAVLAERRGGPWRAVLLDVDNGPDFLLHAENAGLYAPAGIELAAQAVEPGGLLAVWCQGPSDSLLRTMSRFGETSTHTYAVQRGRRTWSYVIYTLQMPGSR